MLHVPRPYRQDQLEPPQAAPAAVQLTLALGDFQGPLDLLLDLAQRQRVDLTRVSIVRLVDQYLSFVSAAQPRLEVAADYLVMAAWLAYLKSRLLVPNDPEPEPEPVEQAARLKHRLARLESMRDAAQALNRLPRLGRDVFTRGAPDGLTVILRSNATANLYGLLSAYADIRARSAQRSYRPQPRAILSIEAARQRLSELIDDLPPWSDLCFFVPRGLEVVPGRGAHASLLVAALEMARTGRLAMRQARPFGPIEIRVA